MAARIRIEINHAEVARLLRGEGEYAGIREDLRRRAQRIADAAGPGNVVEEGGSRHRARFVVLTETEQAMIAEARDRSLSRALDAGR